MREDNVRVVCSRKTVYGKVDLVICTNVYPDGLRTSRQIDVTLNDGTYCHAVDTTGWGRNPTRDEIVRIHSIYRSLASAK